MVDGILKSCVCRTAAVLLALTLLTLPVHGKDRKDRKDSDPFPFKYEARIGWAGASLFDSYVVSDEPVVYIPTLAGLYEDYSGDTYLTGTFSAEFNFQFRKWFALSLGLGYDGIYSRRYSADTGRKTGADHGAIFTFLPQLRFSYLNREYVKLYSSIGVGYTVGTFRGSSAGWLAAQIVPIGVTAGKKVFGFFETGAGTVFLGCRVGVGFRF